MAFWTEIRPPRGVNDSNRSTRPPISRAQRVWKSARRLVVHAPAFVAGVCALSGLIAVADLHATIPSPLNVQQVPAPTSTRAALIDFNTATASELATLPGIGASRAEAIVTLRRQQPFTSLADLVDRGILSPTELLAIADLAAVYVTID
ncbi:MAG: helix-hairpin-helix domain-containing protein [Chloroflexi bacterium]|nr:helix-hairpin-helix domain-containing protein [Chloroflexota bacterium]